MSVARSRPTPVSTPRRPGRRTRRPLAGGFEPLEERQLLSTFTVTNLGARGAGSLRQAIVDANTAPGADTIDFAVAGTIRVGRGSLPRITDAVSLDGSTAPTFVGAPVVAVDFGGTRGLRFEPGADGSTLRSLSLIRAGGAGVELAASRVTVQGNYIGLRTDGTTVGHNHGDGIRIDAGSHDNVIGQPNPVTGVDYYNTDGVGLQPVSGWQGIRAADAPGQYLITGTSNSNGLLYIGPISGQGGTSYAVNVPGAATTSVYGPDNLGGGLLRLVGSYRTGNDSVLGFLFQGTTADLPSGGSWRTIAYPGAQFNYVHSTMGGLAVGNADGPEGNLPLGTGHAFLYDIAKGTFLPDIVYPGSTSTTAYGIWHNRGTSYTIAGGYTDLLSPGVTVSRAYLVDYDSATGQFTHWTSIEAPAGPGDVPLATHFEGISSPDDGIYTLAADTIAVGSTSAGQGTLAVVRRDADGGFGPHWWVPLNYPGTGGITSANSVAGNQVVGIVLGSSETLSYQATVNLGYQRSNVISGNGGYGIGVYGARDNVIATNFIGTDATGTLARPNTRGGIRLTDGASGNLVGGRVTGGNDPTAGVFVRPLQGNLISGNGGDGVRIDRGATANQLSGNFIGTAASGDSALGNRGDGVAIVGADGNALIGCTVNQDPFVFYNVISGNGGNGLRVTNSNDTTVHANFFGVGADNATVVGNRGDGILVSGSSRNTQVGGIIPLGNVASGNGKNGIEVRDTASGFTSFNTFAGLFAFGAAAPNRGDGTLITSRGGNNLIRTCIISGNLGNGVELAGRATGVQVTDTAIGTNTSIQTPLPNVGDGVRITGRAHGNAIGGFQRSIEPRVTISANGGYGIRVAGRARDNAVLNTDLGSNAQATADLGNAKGGIDLGPGTSGTTIGGPGPLQVRVLNSKGDGVTIRSSRGNALLNTQVSHSSRSGVVVSGGRDNRLGSPGAGDTITANGLDGVDVSGVVSGTQIQASTLSGNAGNGVALSSARGLTVGGADPGAGNAIVSNTGYGLVADGLCTGTVVQGNTIAGNTRGNVNLTNSRGIRYTP